MTRYLLSVVQPDGDPPASLDLDQVSRDVIALQDEMKAAGAWVFSGSLHAPSTSKRSFPALPHFLTRPQLLTRSAPLPWEGHLSDAFT